MDEEPLMMYDHTSQLGRDEVTTVSFIMNKVAVPKVIAQPFSMLSTTALNPQNLAKLNLHNGVMKHTRPRGSTISSLSSAHSAATWSSVSSSDTHTTYATTSTEAFVDTITDHTGEYIPHKPPIKIVLGTASVGSSKSPIAKLTSVKQLHKFLWSFRVRGYADIDTARAYPVGAGGTAEELLGNARLRLGRWANTSTKVSSFMPGTHKPKNLAASIQQSLDALGVDSVDIMYLHAPDRATPFYDTCKAMNDAYRQGKFARFGLSNYSIEQIKQIVQICNDNNFVRPAVYQGQYNPICRGAEQSLFTVLRQYNIAFYAYSPSACGFFSDKISRTSMPGNDSRWNVSSPLGAKYVEDYNHEALFAVAEIVKSHALSHGISGHAAALRWTTWHSDLAAERGDAVIVGASTVSQLEENLDILEQGPLPTSLVLVMDQMWREVEGFGKGPSYSFVA